MKSCLNSVDGWNLLFVMLELYQNRVWLDLLYVDVHKSMLKLGKVRLGSLILTSVPLFWNMSVSCQ